MVGAAESAMESELFVGASKITCYLNRLVCRRDEQVPVYVGSRSLTVCCVALKGGRPRSRSAAAAPWIRRQAPPTITLQRICTSFKYFLVLREMVVHCACVCVVDM